VKNRQAGGPQPLHIGRSDVAGDDERRDGFADCLAQPLDGANAIHAAAQPVIADTCIGYAQVLRQLSCRIFQRGRGEHVATPALENR
jgi:hypothetical protein